MKHQGRVIQVEKVQVNGKTYALKLRLIDRGRSYRARFSYCATHESDPEVAIYHDDAQTCLKGAESELTARLAVEWKPSIVIYAEAGDDCSYYGSGSTLFQGRLSFRYAMVDVAKRADGTDVWREPIGAGLVKHGREFHERDGTPHGTVIPDTPENRAKLQVIADGLEKLAANLTLLLSPDRVAKTLQDVRVLALPASGVEPRPKAKRK